MATYNYAALRGRVEKLIARFGTTITLRKSAITGGRAADPTSGTETVNYSAMTAVDIQNMTSDRRGGQTESTKRTLLVSAASGVVPDDNDMISFDTALADFLLSLTLGGEPITLGETELAILDNTAGKAKFEPIEAVRKVSPAGTAVLYEIDLRT